MSFTTPVWDLQAIMNETRAITGRPDVSMMSDQDLVNFIMYYYQFVLPKELKIFWGYTFYYFFTQANVDQYPAPVNFQTLNPQVWADGFPIEWYDSPDNFYSDYPQQVNKVVVGNGNPPLNNFTFQIPAYPVLPWSVYVTDGTQIAQDNGAGGFYDYASGNSLTGTINYVSGAVSGLVFLSIPAANVNIEATSYTYMPNRPRAILFYKSHPLANATVSTRDGVNMFVLRPVPDQVYKMKLQGIQVPAPMVNLTDVPFRADLGPLIALGASIHIFKRFNQMDQIDLIMPEYMRFKDVSMQDTYEELLYDRATPAF